MRAPASWVLREKATGLVICETFDRRKLEALNTECYEAVPIGEYLASLNRRPAPAYAIPGPPATQSNGGQDA